MATPRPRGAGLYCEIFLPASTRRSVLRETQRDSDRMQARPDPNPIPHVLPNSQRTAEAIMRRARDFGPSPTEAVRRLLDAECAKAAGRAGR
jgi:hypothetical protein